MLGNGQDYVPVEWFYYVFSAACTAVVALWGVLWTRISKLDTKYAGFVNAVQEQRNNLEKAILQQGVRFDAEMKLQADRINQQVQQALNLWSTADIANDELRLKAVNERIDGLKTTIEEFVSRQERQHQENRADMQKMEERLNANLNARRDSIEVTMREGFEQVGRIFKDKLK